MMRLFRKWRLQEEVRRWEEEYEALECQRIMHPARVSVVMRRLQLAQRKLKELTGAV